MLNQRQDAAQVLLPPGGFFLTTCFSSLLVVIQCMLLKRGKKKNDKWMNGLEKTTKESPILHNLLPNLGIQEFQVYGSSPPLNLSLSPARDTAMDKWPGSSPMGGSRPYWVKPMSISHVHPCEQGAHRLVEDVLTIPQVGRRWPKPLKRRAHLN